MLNAYSTEKLVGLHDLIVTEIESSETSVTINVEIKRKPHNRGCLNATAPKEFAKAIDFSTGFQYFYVDYV